MRFGDWIGKGRDRGSVSKTAASGAKQSRGQPCRWRIERRTVCPAQDRFVRWRYRAPRPARRLAYWLIDRIAEAIEAGALKDLRSVAAPGSPEAQQVALYGAAWPEISDADWELAAHRIVGKTRAHAFGNALGMMTITEGIETLLVLPDQVTILLHDSLTLSATYLIDRAHPTVTPREH